MKTSFNPFKGGGIQFLDLTAPAPTTRGVLGSANPSDPSDELGALKNLLGTWEGQPNDGWNIIFIPSKKSFIFEVVPFSETLKFDSILVKAENAGPTIDEEEADQKLAGLMYEQIIKSSCIPISPESPNPTTSCKIPEGFTRVCKFPNNGMIHAERGFFLNIENFNEGLNLTRLATIPHGNSVLLLGKSFHTNKPITNSSFIGKASITPTLLDGSPVPILGYNDILRISQFPDFCDFDQQDPNSALHLMLKGKTILEMTTLKFSTEHEDAGILNIPFLQKNINTTKMTATFWIQKIKGEGGEPDFLQLQYTQTMDLVFPINGTPIIWPHVTVNTLRKVS